MFSTGTRAIDFPPADYGSQTITSTAAGLSTSKVASKLAVYITVESAAIRYRMDGTAPTATEGHLVQAGQSIYLADKTKAALTNLSMIRDGASSATIRVTYY